MQENTLLPLQTASRRQGARHGLLLVRAVADPPATALRRAFHCRFAQLLPSAHRRTTFLLLLLGAAALSSGCSVSRVAANSMANVLAEDSIVYAADEDIQLVGEATPFALKTMESVLAKVPEHRGLLTGAARGFTQYAYVYVQLPADELEENDVQAAYSQRLRAKRLYLRARDYGLRGLGFDGTDTMRRLREQPKQVLSEAGDESIELLYWTGLSWAAAISLGKDEPALVADLPIVDEIIARAAELDVDFDQGGLHTFLIGYEMARPGASKDAVHLANHHFERALALSSDQRAAPYVAMAESVAVVKQQRGEYVRLLEQALAVDTETNPEWRLANLVMQRRARWLLEHSDTLFLE
jgi:predicted anti-sigma-YlaC factor YlaD